MRFVFTMNMSPSREPKGVHTVIGEVSGASTLLAVREMVNVENFVLVHQHYNNAPREAAARWEYQQDVLLNTIHIGKVTVQKGAND